MDKNREFELYFKNLLFRNKINMKQLVFLTNQKLNTNYSYTNIVQKVKRGTLNCIEFYDFIQAMGLTVEIK